MDEQGIHAQIAYPNVLGFAGLSAMQTDAELRLAAIQIFNDVRQAQDRIVERAWGAALALVVLILLLTLTARLIARRSRRA